MMRVAARGACALVMTVAGAAPVAAQRAVAAERSAGDDARRADELLSRPVTVDLTRVPRKRAIDAAAASAKVMVQYRAQVIDAYHDLVTVRVKGVPLREALDRILARTTLRVVLDEPTQLAIVERDGKGGVQGTGTVVGRVTDSATGRGIARASVQMQERDGAAVTNADGRFTVRDVPAGERTVTVRLFGYRPAVRHVTVTSGDTAVVAVQLSAVPTALTDVVTTATGQQQRREVGNDITVLNADSIMRTAPVATVTDLLENRVPGLVVQRTSGAPGDPSRIRLRGVNSITGSNDPIVIVDGVRVYAEQSNASLNLASRRASSQVGIPGTANGTGADTPFGYARPSPLNQIDPNSIETIEVLKGPSASALYGSDAANGVIIITTKQGAAGRTRWNLALDAGRTTLPGKYPSGYFVFATSLTGSLSGQLCDDSSGPFRLQIALGQCGLDSTVAFQALNDPRFSPVSGHGTTRRAALTVSGGSAAVLYSVTGSASDELGLLKLPAIEAERFRRIHTFEPPSWMQRPDRYTTWAGTSRLDFQLGTSGGTLALTNGLTNSRQQRSSLGYALTALQGRYINTAVLTTTPLIDEYYERATAGTMTFTNSIDLHQPLWRGIPLNATLGVNVTAADDQTLTPRNYLPNADSLGQASRGHRATLVRSLNVRTTLPSLRTAGRMTVRPSLGVNMYGQTETYVMSTTRGLAIGSETQGLGTIFQGSDMIAGTTGAQASVGETTYGWYVDPQFDFGSRFFANPGVRFDGGSNSGANAGSGGNGFGKFLAYPKLNFSWIAVDQSGDRPRWGFLSQLRPRLALGLAGQQPAPGQKLRLFNNSIGALVQGGTPVSTVDMTRIGNTRLHPERGNEVEGGLDASLWNGRANLTLTAARKLRLDAIQEIQLAPSVGISSVMSVNVGNIRTTSVEATYDVVALDARALRWSVGGTVAKGTNRVLKLAPGFVPDYTLGIVAGYPLFSRWDRPIVGASDLDHNGVIGRNEVLVGDTSVYVGQQLPSYEANVNTSLTLFGRVSVNTTLAYTHGLTQFNQSASDFTAQLYNDPNASLARQAAVIANVPFGDNSLGTPYGLIQTVNTLRWQSLSVSYAVSPTAARRLGLGALSVALQGSNLGLHTNYRGLDPNVNAFSGGNQTADGGQMPQPRLWQLSVRLGN